MQHSLFPFELLYKWKSEIETYCYNMNTSYDLILYYLNKNRNLR